MRRRHFPFALASLGLAGSCSLESTHAASANGPKKLALLIGIDRYRNRDIPQLRGCRNDIEGMRSALIGSHGFRPEDIQMLPNDKATYAGILDAFKRHLLNKASSGDIVVFQYSGHGSRQPSANSASGQGETIVPYDSRDPKNLDITSEALSSMFSELAKRTKNITVILDSCHSGRMIGQVRGVNDKVLVREIDPPKDAPLPPPFNPPAARSLGQASTGFQPLNDSYVLMASVLSSQLAKEYRSGGKSYGAMTFFLLREIGAPPARATYRSIMNVVAQRVSEAVAEQTPQVVGPNADRYVFGISSPPVVPYTLARRDGGIVRLPYSGTAFGIAEGARYDVYDAPPQPSASSAATIEVTRANAYDGEAKVMSGKAPDFGYAVLRERGIKMGRLALWIDPSTKLNEARLALGNAPDFQISGDSNSANLKVLQVSNGIGLYTPDGLPMFDPNSPIPDSPALLRELKPWANWFAMQGLNNGVSDIRITLRLEPVKDRGPSPLALPQLGKAEMVLKEKSVYEPVITNDTDETLYMTLLGLSSDRSISVIFPMKADANAAFEVKGRSEFRLPAISAEIPGCLASSRDVLILFASTQPVGFFPFVQNGFCNGTERTFANVNVETPPWVPGPGRWATARHVVEIRK